MHGNQSVSFGLAALLAFASSINVANAQDASPSPRPDFSKTAIERPLERTLGPTSAIFDKLNPTATAKSDFVNPKVEPGQVIWHQNFNQACASAKVSGKPVLLFQMMGKLDDRFC